MSATNGRIREPEVMEAEVSPSLPMQLGGTVDIQVATARSFPRSLDRFIKRATEMATLTPEIAASCVYALPRSGKTIEGPSARLAEIVAHAWGNLRIQAGATDGDTRYITGRGEAWDVESNVAIAFEVRRRITNSNGQTYNDDMITVTGNAAASIALRNAVFKVVPSSFWKPIYQKCRHVIAGDVKTFASRRDDMLKAFAVMGATEQRVLQAIGLNGKADMTLDHMVTLTGFYNALKEGETTIEEAFPEGGGLGQAPKPAQRKSQSADAPAATAAPAATSAPAPAAPAAPAAAATPAPATTAAASDPPSQVGAIADVKPIANNTAALVVLATGYRAATRDTDVIAAVTRLWQEKVAVELVTHGPSEPGKGYDVIDEVVPQRNGAAS